MPGLEFLAQNSEAIQMTFSYSDIMGYVGVAIGILGALAISYYIPKWKENWDEQDKKKRQSDIIPNVSNH